MLRQRLLLTLALLSLFAIPAVADDVIGSGIDVWATVADGKTFAAFDLEPIPAGFFCGKSAPFTGRIAFKGVPVSSELGRTDTIVERLDDAAFNDKGVASTRIQVRALSLVSTAPVKTACGSYNVKVSLDGRQPVTRMRIVQDHDNGGRFFAPLALNVKMTFVPVSGKGRELEITRNIRFRTTQIIWSFRVPNAGVEKAGFVRVDTDGDGREDTFIPGTSNFAAGKRVVNGKLLQQGQQFDEPWNHYEPLHEHTTTSP